MASGNVCSAIQCPGDLNLSLFPHLKNGEKHRSHPHMTVAGQAGREALTGWPTAPTPHWPGVHPWGFTCAVLKGQCPSETEILLSLQTEHLTLPGHSSSTRCMALFRWPLPQTTPSSVSPGSGWAKRTQSTTTPAGHTWGAATLPTPSDLGLLAPEVPWESDPTHSPRPKPKVGGKLLVTNRALGLAPFLAQCPEVRADPWLPHPGPRTPPLGAIGPAGCLDTSSQTQGKLEEGKARHLPTLPALQLKHLFTNTSPLY